MSETHTIHIDTGDVGAILGRLTIVAPAARHGNDPEMTAHRNRMIIAARDQRATYAEIGAATGLSRTRLDQIIHGRNDHV